MIRGFSYHRYRQNRIRLPPASSPVEGGRGDIINEYEKKLIKPFGLAIVMCAASAHAVYMDRRQPLWDILPQYHFILIITTGCVLSLSSGSD